MESTDPNAGLGLGPGGPPRLPDPGSEPSFLARVMALFSSAPRAFAPPRGLRFWLVPALVVLLVNVLHSVLLQGLYDEWILDFLETNQTLPETQRNAMLDALDARAEQGATVLGAVRTVLGAAGSLVVSFFLLGLVYLAGVNYGLGGSARYLDVVGVLALTSMVLVVREAITIPLKLAQGTLAIHAGPAAFVEADGSLLPVILGFFDVFDLFRLYLLVVGLACVGAVPRRGAAVLVLALWVLGCGITLLWRMSPFGGLAP